MNYILKYKHPELCEDLKAWGKYMKKDNHLALTDRGGYVISTVFLGIDHGFGSDKPVLFETMVFKDGKFEEDLGNARYATWTEAEEGHFATCKVLFPDYRRDDMHNDQERFISNYLHTH